MKRTTMLTVAIAAWMAALGGYAVMAQDTSQAKYDVKVPGGLAFSEFKGYESWESISLSHNGNALAIIFGNPAMLTALRSGIPANGKPFPDGAKMAKVHWTPKPNTFFPDAAVAGALLNVDFMLKDAKRFADSGGWGYGAFDYHPANDTFTPSNMTSSPPQANDAKCGFACHSRAKATDYVFTEYAKR